MRARALPWLLAALGCVDTVPLAVDAQAGDSVVALVVDDRQHVIDLAAFVAPGPGPRLTLPPGARGVSFVIRAADLVDPEGRPLPRAALEEVRAYRAHAQRPDGVGVCGRCLQLSDAPPFVVRGGEACAIPRFSSGDVAGDEADALRDQVILGWPGECGCTTALETAPGPTDWTLAAPSADYWPLATVALTETGTAVLLGERLLASVSTDDGASIATAAPPWDDGLLAANTFLDGRVLVAARDAEAPVQAVGYVLDRALAPSMRPTPLVVQPSRIQTGPGDTLTLLGEGPLREPRAASCNVNLDCTPLSAEGLRFIGRQLRAAIALEDGAWVLVGWHGLIVSSARPDPATVLAITTDANDQSALARGRIETSTGAALHWRAERVRFSDAAGNLRADPGLQLREARGLGAGQIVFCAEGGLDGAHVLSGALDGGAARDPHPPLVLRHTDPSSCAGIIAEAGRPSFARVNFSSGASVVVDQSGAAASVDAAYRPFGADEQVVFVSAPRPGWAVARDLGGTTYARRDDRADFVALRRPPAGDGQPVTQILVADGRALALSHGATLLDLDQGTRVRIGGLAPGAVVTAAAIDRARAALLFVARGADSQLRLQDVPLTSVASPARMIAELHAPVRELVEVSAGRHLLLHTDGTLAVHADGARREVVIDWDDPRTGLIEGAPDPDHNCPLRAAGQDVLRDASSALGATWVVGCDGTLLSVNVFGDRPSAQRVSLDLEGGPLARAAVLAAHAWCPDRLAMAARDVSGEGNARGDLLLFDDAGGGRADVRGGHSVRALVEAPSNAFPYLPLRLPLALGGDHRLVLGFERGVRTIHGGDVLRLEDAVQTVIGDGEGGLWAGTRGGRVLHAR